MCSSDPVANFLMKSLITLRQAMLIRANAKSFCFFHSKGSDEAAEDIKYP